MSSMGAPERGGSMHAFGWRDPRFALGALPRRRQCSPAVKVHRERRAGMVVMGKVSMRRHMRVTYLVRSA